MRIHTIGSAMAILAALAAAPAFAQDAKADDVLAQTRKAIGHGKLETLKSLSVQAAIQRNVNNMQMNSDAELLIEMPDKYVRTDTGTGMMSMTTSTGFNGDKGILPGGGTMAPGGAMVIRMGPGGPINDGPKPTPEQLAEMSRVTARSQRMELSRLMLGWFGMAHPSLSAKYTYAGEAESADGKAHVIDVKDADGFAARLFIDQNNYLPLMVTFQGRAPRIITAGGPAGAAGASGATATVQHAPGQAQTRQLSEEDRKKLQQDAEKQMAQAPTVEVSLFFDDWRDIDGITFPHTIRRASAGTTTEEWTINKVKVNPKIDAKKFAVETK